MSRGLNRHPFPRDNAEAARKQWRQLADQAKPRISKLAALMDEAESDVLADVGFLAEHWTNIHGTNPLERLNGEIKRRSEVMGVCQRGCRHSCGGRAPA